MHRAGDCRSREASAKSSEWQSWLNPLEGKISKMSHSLIETMQNSAFSNMTPTENNEPKAGNNPFQSLADSFADTQQGQGKATEGPNQSQTVTSFSAHMKPWSDEVKPRRGRK